jgi:hypothetical protein
MYLQAHFCDVLLGPALTSTPLGSSVHWMGRDFSLVPKSGLTTVHFVLNHFLRFLFLLNSDLTYLSTHNPPFLALPTN